MTRFFPLFILFIVLLSFGQSVNFALWQDDNALIFKLQHLDEQVGVFGPGPFGLGAYRYIAVPYIPIYSLFGLNTVAFYVWAVFFYFLASVSIFFLSLYFTKNKFLALLSGGLFGAGFIGSDGILRLFNSIQTSYSVIFTTLLFFLLHRFAETKRTVYYLLGLLSFFVALETAFIRTQYLILPVIVFCVLFLSSKLGSRQTVLFITPFLLVYYFIFQRSTDPRSALVNEYTASIFSGKLEYTHSLFGSLGNVVIPEPITQLMFSFAGNLSLDYTNRLLILELAFLLISVFVINLALKRSRRVISVLFTVLLVSWFIFGMIYFQNSESIFSHSQDVDTSGVFANFVGGLFLIFIGAILLTVWRKNSEMGRVLIFLIVWLLANILAYSVYLPFSPLESINRYLVHSLAAYAILTPLAWGLMWKRLGSVLAVIMITSNIFFSIAYQSDFFENKSKPTNAFYSQLKAHLPEIFEGSVLYFDVADNERSQQEFRDFFSVASMPDSTAIAVRYGIDRYDLAMTRDFAEFLSLIQGKPLNLVYSFFYKDGQLIDTADQTRFNLAGRVESAVGQSFRLVTPAVLEFNARANPKISIEPECQGKIPVQDRLLFFAYLLSKDDLRKNVKVVTTSQEKYQPSKFLSDGKPETLWRASRGLWHIRPREEITIDLGQIWNVGQLVWVNGYANSTPTVYRIEVSTDKKSWLTVKEVVAEGKKKNGQVVVENFKPEQARLVRIIIEDTYDNDSPAIGEIEVVDQKFVGVEKRNSGEYAKRAFCAEDKEAGNLVLEFVSRRGIETVISWQTDKTADNKVEAILDAGNRYQSYKVLLHPGGTEVHGLQIESSLVPADIDIQSMRLVYPSAEKLRKLLGLQE